jgi:hypothetical protein
VVLPVSPVIAVENVPPPWILVVLLSVIVGDPVVFQHTPPTKVQSVSPSVPPDVAESSEIALAEAVVTVG